MRVGAQGEIREEMAGIQNILPERLRRKSALGFVGLIAWAVFMLWGFGLETVGGRLMLELDGVVISRQEIPRTAGVHGTGTIYVVREADGTDHKYIAGATDASLSRDIPKGTYLKKQKWDLSYTENGVRVDDFSRVFYGITCGIALACLLWGVFQLARQHE